MLQKAHLSTKQNALSTSFEYSNATAIDSQDPDVSFGDKSMGDRRMTIIGMPTWLVEFNTLRETPIVRNNKRIAAARTIHRWFQNVRTRQNLPKSRSDNLIISDKLGNTKIAGADGGPSTSTMLAPAISLITAALKIQSAWKKFVARSEFLLKIKAVSMIQRWYREMRSDASDKRNTAATKIQHIWRLKLIAIYENRLDLAARIIQRAFRRCKARRRDNSALAIQSWWRKISNYQRCVKVSAAVTIQRCLRGFMVRCKYGLIRHAVIKIQSLWRAKLQSRKYHFALIDIIKCQSIARMQIARKKLRRQLVLIRKVQAQIKMKQQRKAFKTARNGIILLQKLVRRNLVFTARKRESAAKVIQRKWLSHRKNNAAIVIQKHWILVLRERRKSYLISRLVIFQAHCRKFLERKKYQLTRNACITIQRAYRKFLAKSVSILSILTITNKRRATRRPSDINIPACAVENIKSKKRRKSISKENWGTVSPVAIPERLVEHKPKEVLTSSENFPKYSTKSPKPKITSSSLANITANAEKIASIESFYSKSPASRLPAGRKLLLKSKEGLQNTSISNMSAESPVKQSILTLSVRQSHATEIPICPSTFDNHARILDSDISQQQAKRGPVTIP